MKEVQAQTTKMFKWISSGQTASDIYVRTINNSETMVSSMTMTDSGNGHYYAFMTMPTTPGLYAGEVVATIGSKDYINKTRFRVVLNEV